ncbi:MAG TPA: KEOPS complex subunit Pcc1 [Nitrososphaera sp.]|nr:KEOPS complex subunit Pcc1 [Nitrososphaera sp.]
MTSKACRAEIRIRVKGRQPSKAESICSALDPDLKKLEEKNEKLRLKVSGPSLVFSIETGDLASLRANVNSYLRLVDAAHRCLTL